MRFLRRIEEVDSRIAGWELGGITDPFQPVTGAVSVTAMATPAVLNTAIDKVLEREKHFVRQNSFDDSDILVQHQLGWRLSVRSTSDDSAFLTISALSQLLDPLIPSSNDLLSDLHVHTAWSDGNASVNTMARAVVAHGLKYFAVTDHSRSCKLQSGLTPLMWLRQDNALTLAAPVCPVLHGIEVDILGDGTLDLPDSILAAADLVVASVHSSWSDDARVNTERLLRAIESGYIDVLAHPTSAVVGTPGVPNYFRPRANVVWLDVFRKCSEWRVAVEFNCFPSRLDLSPDLLSAAVDGGCAISLGSDAHSRSHLINLRFGDAVLRRIDAPIVLNRFSYDELRNWIVDSRASRRALPKTAPTGQKTFRL